MLRKYAKTDLWSDIWGKACMTFPCSCAIALLRNTPEHFSGSLWEWNQNRECFNIKTLYLPTCVHLQRTKRDIRPMNTVYTVPHTAAGWSATCKQHTDILFEIIAVWIQSVGLKFTSPFPYMHVLYMHNMTCRKCSRIYNL